MRSWLLLLLVAGCDQPHWSLVAPDLDRVALSVWGQSPRDAFVVGGPLGSAGDSLFVRYDGASLHPVDVGLQVTLWWVFGLSSSDVYAVGEAGTVLRWDGTALSRLPVPTTDTLFGIWGTSDDDLWAVGGKPDQSGTLLHKDASGWHLITGLPNTEAYFKVWGAAANDVYVCGQGGTILHWDGATFTNQPTGLPPAISLFTVDGRSATDVYAVGGLANAVALHNDGRGWVPVADPALTDAGPLAGVSVAADGSVIFVGGNGEKLRGRPGALQDESSAVTRTDLHTAAIIDGEILAVGGNWLAPAPATRHGVIARYGN
jgi:hypothetical protein